MQIIIEVQEQRSIDAVVEFSRKCRDTFGGNVDWLDVIKEGFVEQTGCNYEDVTVREMNKDIPLP